MNRKPKPKYLNAQRRELLLWICSLQLILQENRDYFRDKEELKWLDSTNLSIDSLARAMCQGIDQSDLRAIENAVNLIEPRLNAEKLVNSKVPTVKCNIDVLYDLGESAVELCKYECNKDFDNCPRRKLFLELLIPPWSETGPCQYWRGEPQQKEDSKIEV